MSLMMIFMIKVKFLKTIQTFDTTNQMVYFQKDKTYEITEDHYLYKRINDLKTVIGWIKIIK